MLDGLHVAMGVSGSIAAVRCVELIHELRRRGAAVRVVMSEAATGIVHPDALAYASGAPAVVVLTGDVEHVELCGTDGWADVLLLAPATANTVGKVAAAIDDTPVTTCATTAIGAGIPLVVAPAMHEPMYDHPGVTANLETLAARYGATIVPPRIAEGKAKIAEDGTIALAVARATGPATLAGRHVTVLSGATAEPVDPVRALKSNASGKTGRAVAEACYTLGADVSLIHDGRADVPYADEVVVARTVDAFAEAALERAGETDAMVFAAAISDFTVEASEAKLDSGVATTIHLEPAPKVIEAVRDAAPDLTLVGFKAEATSDEGALVEAARALHAAHGTAFVVANDAGVMGADETRVLLVDDDEARSVAGSKRTVGTAIADRLATVLQKTK